MGWDEMGGDRFLCVTPEREMGCKYIRMDANAVIGTVSAYCCDFASYLDAVIITHMNLNCVGVQQHIN